jgi:glutamyl-tRNA reductase
VTVATSADHRTVDASGAWVEASAPSVDGSVASASRPGGPWVLSLDAHVADPETRAAFAKGLAAADVGRFGWLVLHTCRRVELLGSGPRPAVTTLAALTGLSDAARATVHVGDDACRRVLRLATGLESVVVGEDQILGQVRELRRRAASREPAMDGRLIGLLDAAIHVGRRARRERPRAERSLADRAVAWLAGRLGSLDGAHLLVVGSGPIGREAARVGALAGARVVVASRTVTSRAPSSGLARITLDDAARGLHAADAAVVALGGTWTGVIDVPLGPPSSALPFVVDLSAPPAIPGPVRALLGHRLATLDEMAATAAGTVDGPTRAYAVHAEALVEQAIEDLARRGDPSVSESIRAARSAAEARHARHLDELMRRLPGLTSRERALIERFSRRLVASVIHEPTVALRGGRG